MYKVKGLQQSSYFIFWFNGHSWLLNSGISGRVGISSGQEDSDRNSSSSSQRSSTIAVNSSSINEFQSVLFIYNYFFFPVAVYFASS